MCRRLCWLALASLAPLAFSPTLQDPDPAPAIKSRVLETSHGERVLIQEARLAAPLATVWSAYTTSAGWTGWAVPVADVDVRVGGTIRTHYDPTAKIGDAGTNTLHVVNYVPERVLTLQAELAANWPEVMKHDAEHLMNVIVFDAIDDEHTLVSSYGIGYRDHEAYDDLLKFFVSANEGLLRKLRAFVERGERADWGK